MWDKRSGRGWHPNYGANARTPAEKQVFEEFLKTPEVRRCNMRYPKCTLSIIFIQHTALKPFATKSWPFYHRMKGFMPGGSADPRGPNAFEPSTAGSSADAVQMLNNVNAEEDGEEDQDSPPFDTPLANIASTSSFPPVTSDLNISEFGVTPSVASESAPSLPPDFSGGTEPPSSSSLAPSAHHYSTQRHDVSMGSTLSHNTSSDPGNTQRRKRKHDGQSAVGTRSSKRSARSKTSDLNPVIISNALNSTLNRLADVMEKTLDTTATTMAPAAPDAIPSISNSSTQSMSNPPLASSDSFQAILNQAIEMATSDDTLSEVELLAASLFFTSATEEAVRVARTFNALKNKPAVQRSFLLRHLDAAALLPGKGKGRAVEEGDDSMSY